MIYYIADTHFGDERIMRFAHRPFESVEEMDKYMCDKWNRKVKDNDTSCIVGDFALNDEVAQRMFLLLKGHKHLVLGNHDKFRLDTLKLFKSVSQIVAIQDDGRSVCLCHYPLLSYENSGYGGYHIFGHLHNNKADAALIITKYIHRIYNCGADVNCFEPQALGEIIRRKACLAKI